MSYTGKTSLYWIRAQTNRKRRPDSYVSDAIGSLKLDTGVVPEVAFDQSAPMILETRKIIQLLTTDWKVLFKWRYTGQRPEFYKLNFRLSVCAKVLTFGLFATAVCSSTSLRTLLVAVSHYLTSASNLHAIGLWFIATRCCSDTVL